MTPRRAALAVALLFLAGIGSAGAEDHAVCTDPLLADGYSCREVVVEFDPAAFTAASWNALAQKYDLELVGLIPELYQGWFEAKVGTTDILGMVGLIALEPGVHEAEVNGDFVPPECRQLSLAILELGAGAGPLFRSQPALRTVRARSDPMLGEGIIVAVLDTGISQSQPELRGRLMLPGIAYESSSRGYADDTGNGIDDDGSGVIDDGYGHGTSVAGIIHLLAPGARLLSVKVLDDECHGRAFALASGIVAAVQRGARVLNLSFGSQDGSGVITAAIRWANEQGAVVVAPTGNDSQNDVQFPATKPETISVAAVDDSLRATAFTNYKKDDVDLSAPGLDIVTTRRDSFWRISGTSAATAFVSAAAAIAMQARPALGPAAIESLLRSTAIPVDPHNPDLVGELGAGVPDLGRLARLVRGRRLAEETSPPFLPATTSPVAPAPTSLPIAPSPSSAP